jgi:F-type H+-transporting ATPase subunit epsilon
MAMTVHLDIVSAEKSIFSGLVEHVTVSGQDGELGIYPGHTPLLTGVKPGEVVATRQNGQVEIYYISGGMLEVQPEIVTILADTVVRADDIDLYAAEEAQKRAREALAHSKDKSSIDYEQALIELAEASARIRAVKNLGELTRKNKFS